MTARPSSQVMSSRLILPVIVSLLSTNGPCYVREVTQWLDGVSVPWREVKFDGFPVQVLAVGQEEKCFALHLLATPTCEAECVSPTLAVKMTESCIAGNLWADQVIHLHQDVWRAKGDIVRCRLMARLGNTNSRVFARKTNAHRIDAAIAMAFLETHHLWGATKAKYYYGLFAKEELVAVATFSSRRKVLRDGRSHRSHELVRFCSKRDGTVVGGITKLIKSFVVENKPDDIVTVVDRDWGSGSGWHKLGFETVHIMPPLTMAVSAKDGLRRHLVGAGIQNEAASNGRLGLPLYVLEELNSIDKPIESLNCLSRHDLFLVHDTGVERLMMLVPDLEASGDANPSVKDLWQFSKPTYASSYYSGNSGIAALLSYAEIGEPSGSMDSKEELASVASWRSTSGTASSARLVFSAPSSLDANAILEVQERSHGWRTVRLAGGLAKSMYHGVYKVRTDGTVDPSICVVEHLRGMASLALAALEMRIDADNSSPIRFLHFGFGAGTLARLLCHYIPNSEHVAVELDTAVVAAADFLPAQPNLRIETGDAFAYKRTESERPFDCVFLDIFGADNVLPSEFYSAGFLARLRDSVLGPRGLVVHNFHTGAKKNTCKLQDAKAAYADAFVSCCIVDSLDSKPNGGNAILLGSKFPVEGDHVGELLSASAVQAQQRWGLRFDAESRVKRTQHVATISELETKLRGRNL